MYKKLSVLFFILFLFISQNILLSQNLVPNPSFEENTGCPGATIFLSNTLHWNNVEDHLGTPDLFWKDCPYNGIGKKNQMAFGQLPYEGLGFIGMFAHGDHLREYCTVMLKEELEKGITYSIQFWVRPANGYGTSINSFGLHFSKQAIKGNSNLKYLPLLEHIGNPEGRILSDTSNWTAIEGQYTAMGGEKHITIGNFRSDSDTKKQVINLNCIRFDRSYILLDNVSVKRTTNEQINLKSDTLAKIKPVDIVSKRKAIIKETYYTSEKNLKIQIWDHNRVDGDSISLILNNSIILEGHALTKSLYTIDLTLKKGDNLLEVLALNLGKYPPNTVSILIPDGKKQKRIVLNSNLKESEAVLFVFQGIE